MIETIVIRNIKRDHSDKPTVVLSETEFEKEESYHAMRINQEFDL
jgi:hypothetical protein